MDRYGPRAIERQTRPVQVMWDCLRSLSHLHTDAFAFADAFQITGSCLPDSSILMVIHSPALDSDACMCALTAVKGSIDLGYGEGDFDASAEAAHERAGLLFAKGSNCFGLAIEWVPALVNWHVDQYDVHEVVRQKQVPQF